MGRKPAIALEKTRIVYRIQSMPALWEHSGEMLFTGIAIQFNIY